MEVHADLWRLSLVPEPEPGLALQARIDPTRPVAFGELDKLRDLVEIEVHGRDAEVVAYARRRKTLRTLRWLGHRASRIDLGESALNELAIDVEGPVTLVLPPSLTTLRLLDVESFVGLRVESDDAGARLAVWVWAPRGPLRAFAGLSSLGTLSVAAVKRVDLAALEAWPALRALELFGDDAGLEVKGLAELAGLSALERLSIRNGYHTNFGGLPAPGELPSLKRLELDGVRTEAAALVKERYRGFRGLSVRGVRTDAWLRANADNPFRQWDEGHSAPIAARAKKAWRVAQAAVDADVPSAKHAEAILRTFVDTFNPVADDIDTIMREEIDAAYAVLADRLRAHLPWKQAIALFDSWRDF